MFLHVFARRPLGIWATLSICFAKFGAYATTLTTQDEPEPLTEGGTQTAIAYYHMGEKRCPLEKYNPDQGDEPDTMIEGGTQTAVAYYHMGKKGYPREKHNPDQGVAYLEKHGPDQDEASCAHKSGMERRKGLRNMKLTMRTRSVRYEDEDEITWLMQALPDEAAWITSLRVLREKLEEMTKARRAVVVDALLRRMDWHCTNTRDGYFLGHMGGRAAMLTSLLVTAQRRHGPGARVPSAT